MQKTFIKGSALWMMRVVCHRISHRWMKMTAWCSNRLTLHVAEQEGAEEVTDLDLSSMTYS